MFDEHNLAMLRWMRQNRKKNNDIKMKERGELNRKDIVRTLSKTRSQ